MINFKKTSLGLAVVTALGFSGCGSSSSDNTPSLGDDEITTKNYNGAGSRWDLSFQNDGNATIKEANSNLEINATYEDLASGFRKITTTSSNDISIVDGTITYGFELPNYMFPFVSFTENKLLPTIINDSGECPTVQNHNFVTSFAKSNSSASDFDEWGTFGFWKYNSDENKTQVDVFKRDGTLNADMNFNGSIISNCSNGKYYDPVGDPTDPDNAKTTAYFSKIGGIIWHQDAINDDRIENDFMIPKETNLNTINQINGEYIGYSISGNGSYINTPVNVVSNNGALVVKELNITNNTIGNKLSDISLTTEVSGTKGLWHGQITTTTPSGTEGIGCAIDLDAGGSGKNVIICGGMLPDGTKKNLYSLILVTK